MAKTVWFPIAAFSLLLGVAGRAGELPITCEHPPRERVVGDVRVSCDLVSRRELSLSLSNQGVSRKVVDITVNRNRCSHEPAELRSANRTIQDSVSFPITVGMAPYADRELSLQLEEDLPDLPSAAPGEHEDCRAFAILRTFASNRESHAASVSVEPVAVAAADQAGEDQGGLLAAMRSWFSN